MNVALSVVGALVVGCLVGLASGWMLCTALGGRPGSHERKARARATVHHELYHGPAEPAAGESTEDSAPLASLIPLPPAGPAEDEGGRRG